LKEPSVKQKQCKFLNQERNEEGKCVKKCLSEQVRYPITKRCRTVKVVKNKSKKINEPTKKENLSELNVPKDPPLYTNVVEKPMPIKNNKKRLKCNSM